MTKQKILYLSTQIQSPPVGQMAVEGAGTTQSGIINGNHLPQRDGSSSTMPGHTAGPKRAVLHTS